MRSFMVNLFKKIVLFLLISIPLVVAIYIFLNKSDFTGTQIEPTTQKITKISLARASTTSTSKKPLHNTEGLIIVNKWTPLPSNYSPTLIEVEGEYLADESCVKALQNMLSACRESGLNPLICSAYRTKEEQQALFENQVNRYLNDYSPDEAEELAEKIVAAPDTSEHQLGLAFDIVDTENQLLDESQEFTAVQEWLMDNCTNFGFILRYPKDKTNITGVIYEPWHYRFVGIEAAKEITRNNQCLEEYLV